MPDIDAVTIATPAGNSPQSVLFSVPTSWPAGEYHAYIEVNVEGDYNSAWSSQRFPTPKTPPADRDSFSYDYGYPYRGQPSLVWKVSFALGSGSDLDLGALEPAGRSSWDYWAASYGTIEPSSVLRQDPNAISAAVLNSGVERLITDASGRRFSVQSGRFASPGTTTVPERPRADPEPDDVPAAGAKAEAPPAAVDDAGVKMQTGGRAAEPAQNTNAAASSGNAEPARGEETVAHPGPVRELSLSKHPDPLRAHKWVHLRMRAVESALPLHAYEVRVSPDPITDEQSFIRQGRQAKNASDAKEGPSYLQLPADVPAGEWIDATIGDLYEHTHYYVGVRARDLNNQAGPVALAELTTPKREFATVSPCFVATVAYGSPLADEVGALRRLRDRYLLPHALGQGLVTVYYRYGAQLAGWVEPHPTLRAALRLLLTPLVKLAEQLPD
jgi:hypothetical protein